MAAALPGDSFTSEVVVGGVLNFLSIYNLLITGRVLLSWVPQVFYCVLLGFFCESVCVSGSNEVLIYPQISISFMIFFFVVDTYVQ